MPITNLKPTSKGILYDLLGKAGIDTSDWAQYKRSQAPASNPRFCYNWSFEGPDRVVLCLWYQDFEEENDVIFQSLNLRAFAESPHLPSPTQKLRATRMDQAIRLAHAKRLPVRVIIVDRSVRGETKNSRRSHVARRMLDSESWHVASYDEDTGECRLQRGPWPTPPEAFTPAEITAAGTFDEGASKEITARARERSARLRDLARAHFAARSPDGRLRCSVCDWAPPAGLPLTSPIVEIHHGVSISTYPADGKALPFEKAVQHLTPLCPNCHRILHAKVGGGTFTTAELKEVIFLVV